ncbi:MAG: exonuclease SbcCD subunit D [Lachnospiraceae bacterium]|nr:exonuclease SbcCD subunit D [Lachnospiraceae bacterium]
MKFLHTADLHIGKKIFELSLIKDQKYILKQIVDIAKREQVDAVLIAGDVYDRTVPSTEAVMLLDEFLTSLQKQGIQVIMISGNHDSPERVAFADAILEKQGIHIAGGYQSPLKMVVLEDEYGPVYFVCMPFVKPAITGGSNSAEAVEHMLSGVPMTMGMHQRYVLIAHYFVTGEHGEIPELSDSETDVQVGGLDSVPASCFQNFCYTALGHIHKRQRIGDGNIYYSGSPLKYSFSEAGGEKSVNIVELQEPGKVKVRAVKLKPLREMRCIKGRLMELISPSLIRETQDIREDYFQVTLTDKEELIDPIGTLRGVYPNVLQLVLERNSPGETVGYESSLHTVKKSTAELFGEFYEMLMGEPMDEKRRLVVEEAATEAERTVQ